MKSMRKELWFNIPTQRAFVNITRQVGGLPEGKRHPGRPGPHQDQAYQVQIEIPFTLKGEV
jgi:hypothetical protein